MADRGPAAPFHFRELIGELVEIGRTGAEDGEEAVEWRIPNALSRPGGRYDWYQSPGFHTTDGDPGEWYLRFFPNWADGRVRLEQPPPRESRRPPSGAVRLSLARTFRDHRLVHDLTRTRYRFSVGIGGVEMAREGRKVFPEDHFCHWIALYSRLELREHLEPDGALVVRLVLKRECLGRACLGDCCPCHDCVLSRRPGASVRDDSETGGQATSDDGSQSIDTQGHQSSDKCIVCCEQPVDCALYRCGHMCMCYNCAFKHWKSTDVDQPVCPICRNHIQDVLKVYK